MLSRKVFWFLLILVALCGTASGVLLSYTLIDLSDTRAVWKDVYRRPDAMAKDVDAILVGKVIAVLPGRVAVSEQGDHSLQYQLVEIQAEMPVKGVGEHEYVLLERASNAQVDGLTSAVEADGGPLKVGSSYLLFLKRQPDSSYYYQVNDQGRFRLSRGRLYAATPESDDSVKSAFEGRSVAESVVLLRQWTSDLGREKDLRAQ